WRRTAGRVHHSYKHHNSGLPQHQGLQGIRARQPARRLEYLGHIRDLAGGTDAERPAATNDHKITKRRFPREWYIAIRDQLGSQLSACDFSTRSLAAASPPVLINPLSVSAAQSMSASLRKRPKCCDDAMVPVHDASVSSSALASFRSSVSKPSVNQP